MALLRRALAHPSVSAGIGYLGSRYLKLVEATNRFDSFPTTPFESLGLTTPLIVATWHGQQFLTHVVRRRGDAVAALASRSRDGELNASVLRHLGVRAIRGSGARGRDPRSKGGAQALRQMIRALGSGENVVLTADVPKQSRVCGAGVIQLAKLSGRPILPLAVVTSRRIDFDSWDHASISLPFGHGAMVFGAPIEVSAASDSHAIEDHRRDLQTSLNDVHRRAFESIGSCDPGDQPA